MIKAILIGKTVSRMRTDRARFLAGFSVTSIARVNQLANRIKVEFGLEQQCAAIGVPDAKLRMHQYAQW